MTGGDQPARGERATQILDVAERLVQVHGFNGFSYADVAGELGVTTAALHYHFPGKAELGQALIGRYADRFAEALRAVDGRGGAAPEKLEAYARLYRDVLRDRRMCLCGMLAAEYQTLPGPMRDTVVRFFDDNEVWLAGVLDSGRSEGTVRFDGSSAGAARALIGGLEGAMLVAIPYAGADSSGSVDRFESVAGLLLAGLVVATPAPTAGEPGPAGRAGP